MAVEAFASNGTADTAPFSIRSILGPLAALIISCFMVMLDGTATNVAIPTLARTFHDPLTTIQWVVTGYSLAQAAVIPLAGWLSDRFTPKRILLISLILFTIGSVMCAVAQTSSMLIAFRVLQGLGGGMVMPISIAYIYRLAPPDKTGTVLGFMGVPMMVAPALGPILGGWLVQDVGWRWIFLINVPVCLLAVTLGLRLLPDVARSKVATLDLPGVILAPLAFASLVYGMNQGSTSWTSINTLAGLSVGLVALLAFVMVELRTANPLLELHVFRSLDFSRAIVTQWIVQFAMFGVLFLVPLFLQQVRGYGALDTGFTLLPQALLSMIVMPISGQLYDRFGARPLVVTGAIVMIAANVLLGTLSVTTRGFDLILPLAMNGVGLGLMMMPLNTQVLNSAPRALVGRVSSLTSALQQVISAVSIAVLTTILTSRITMHTQELTNHVATGTHGTAGQGSTPLQHILSVASATSYDDIFHIMIGVGVVAAFLGLLLRRRIAPAAEGESLDEVASQGAQISAIVA